MRDAYKPKEQLVAELEELRQRLAIVQSSDARDAWTAVESALRESEERYRELFENAHDIVYTHDLTGHFTSINRAAEAVTGYTHAETLQLSLGDLVAPEYADIVREMLDPSTRSERSRCELELVGKDGRRVAVEVNTRLVMHGDRPVGVQGIARDVTERRRTEQALRIQHTQQQTVLDLLPAMMVYTDVTGRILRINRRAAAFIGRPVVELVDQPVETASPALASALLADFPTVVETMEPKQGVLREVTMGGERRWLRIDTVPHAGQKGPVEAIIVFAVDITDQKQAEQALRESEAQFRALFELAPIGIARLDGLGRIIDCNRVFEAMFGWSLAEVRERTLVDLSHPDEMKSLATQVDELWKGERQRTETEQRFVRRDGTVIWGNLTASVVRDGQDRTAFVIAAIEDVSDRRRAEEALRQSNQRLSGWVAELEERNREINLLSEMGDMLQACRNIDEAHAVISRMARQLFVSDNGYVCAISAASNLVEAVAVWGTPAGEHYFSQDDCWSIRRGRVHLVQDPQLGLMCKHLNKPLDTAYMCVPMMAQGEAIGLLHLSLSHPGRLSEAKQRLVMTVAEHIALSLANLKLQDTLRGQSIRDPLTGLFNRRYMEESLDREMRRAVRGRHPVGIIMLDIDHFKAFNDTFGHEAGDALLREVGQILQRSIRGEDIACRYGGEEFTLILPEASLPDAAQRAEQIREAIRDLDVHYRHQPLGRVTVSLGVAIFPDHGPRADAVIRAADAALYQAKAAGRDRVAVNPGGSAGIGGIVDLSRT